jgi:hypothetical protein
MQGLATAAGACSVMKGASQADASTTVSCNASYVCHEILHTQAGMCGVMQRGMMSKQLAQRKQTHALQLKVNCSTIIPPTIRTSACCVFEAAGASEFTMVSVLAAAALCGSGLASLQLLLLAACAAAAGKGLPNLVLGCLTRDEHTTLPLGQVYLFACSS